MDHEEKFYSANAVIKNGVKLLDYKEGMAHPVPKDGAHIIAVFNNGLYMIAQDVTTAWYLKDITQGRGKGHWTPPALYEVPKNKLVDCRWTGMECVPESDRTKHNVLTRASSAIAPRK